MTQIKFWVALVFVFGFGSSLFAQHGRDDNVLIYALITEGTDAWNNHDADALASLVDDAVIYVSSDGKQIQGKEAYRTLHKQVFENPAFKDTKSYNTLRNLHIFPASEGGTSLAILDMQWLLTSIHGSANKDAPDRQGHSELILRKNGEDGDWKLLAHKTYRQEPDREAAVRAVFAERLRGWEEKNVDVLLNSMADDVIYESSNGETISGKTLLRERYSALLTGPLKSSKHTETIKSIRFVQDDLVLVNAQWKNEIEGASKSGTSTALLRKFQEKNWKVVSLQPAVATKSKGE